MTNILLVIPNLGSGGAQKVFREQFKFYSAHCHVIGCVFNKDNLVEADKSLSIVSLNVPAGKNLFSKIFYFLLRVLRLRSIKKKHRISITISHLEGADYVNILSTRKGKKICWVHGTKKFDHNIEGWMGWMRKKIFIPYLYNRFDRIVCVSDGIKNELIHEYKLNPQLLSTLPNGFDREEIVRNAKVKDLSRLREMISDIPVLITHGRLARQKNLDSLIAIFNKVKKKLSVKLLIIGDGELRDQLLTRAEFLGLKSYATWRNDLLTPGYDVYFAGYMPNPYPLLSIGTIYLMTSSWEGFPLALGEAMLCGVPVVAADCFTGPREILAPEIGIPQPVTIPLETPYGILMPLADLAANLELWQNVICQLLEDEPKRKLLATSARHRMQDFDQKEIQKSWLKLIHG